MKTLQSPAGSPATGSDRCSFRINSKSDLTVTVRATEMKNAVLKRDDTPDAALFTDVKSRFYAAVHTEPVLFHDVLQTGTVMKGIKRGGILVEYESKLPFEIVLLHSGNVDDVTLGKMFDLQDKVAVVNAPDARNVIDYKTENEVVAHYANGGLGLAILGVDGSLIGQTMLSFDDTNMHIGWVMVDKDFGGNQLCERMLRLATDIAEASKMETISAAVRIANRKAIDKFSLQGFNVTGTGQNAKDGAKTLNFGRETKSAEPVCEHMGTRPLSLQSLQAGDKIDYLESMIEQGYTVKWNRQAQWFTFCTPEIKPVQLNDFKLG